MYQREWFILKELEKGGYLTSAYFSKKLQLSVKTIQKSILSLQVAMSPAVATILSQRGKGYCLVIRNQTLYQDFRTQFQRESFEHAEQRKTYLLNQLLTHSYIKAEQVEEIFYTSKKTVSNTIRQLKKDLKVYNIEIKNRPYYGLYLAGKEESVRLMMSVTEGVELYHFSEEENQAVHAFLESSGLDTEFDRANILEVLRVAITRAHQGKSLSFVSASCDVRLSVLSTAYGWSLTEADMLSVQDAIESFRVKGSCQDSWEYLQDSLAIVTESFGIDFTEDLQFMENLVQHIQKLEERVKNHIVLKNPLLSEIKQNLKNEFVMASLLSGFLSKKWGETILEDEIGFLSLIFATSTSHIGSLKKHLLVICFEGTSGKEFLENSYKRLFGRYIHQVTVCNPGDLGRYDLAEYDCIVSTVELPELEAYQPQYVSYFLEEREKEAIKRQLTTSEDLFVDSLLETMIFLPQIRATTKEEAIRLICCEIEKQTGTILTDKVLQRLSMGVTQLGEKVVFLHPKGQVDQHFISVSVLSEPLYWEHAEVRLVCLVSLPTIDRISKLLYQILSTFMIEEFYVDWLVQSPTSSTLQLILQKIKEKELVDYVY